MKRIATIALTCIALAVILSAPAQAAQPAPPVIVPCQVVNTFGDIQIARCKPEEGEPFLVNSFGFMLVED